MVHCHCGDCKLKGTVDPRPTMGDTMSATATTMTLGALLLVALAVLVGLIDTRAQRRAWRRIAAHRQALRTWEQEIRSLAESGRCTRCQRRRQS